MKSEYEKAYEKTYKSSHKVTVGVIGFCAKCNTRVKVEDRIPEGVYWDPALTCGKCGHVWIVTVHIKKVESP